MSPERDRWVRIGVPLLLIAAVVTIVGAVVVAAGRAALVRAAAASYEPAGEAVFDDPIAAEVQVFRTSASVLAIDPLSRDRRPAHPRTLARYRLLRAYPGAPPRIPHGLTPEESQTGRCNTCHERGGYSERFGAYVPLNPHPELGACLSCHVGDATLLAVPLPGTDPNARCRQCHAPGARRWSDSAIVWKPMTWPQLARDRDDGSPPPIPHDRAFRGNCLACHSAPSAVAEIATSHPDRADCRQCHVEAGAGMGAFVRSATRVQAGARR